MVAVVGVAAYAILLINDGVTVVVEGSGAVLNGPGVGSEVRVVAIAGRVMAVARRGQWLVIMASGSAIVVVVGVQGVVLTAIRAVASSGSADVVVVAIIAHADSVLALLAGGTYIAAGAAVIEVVQAVYATDTGAAERGVVPGAIGACSAAAMTLTDPVVTLLVAVTDEPAMAAVVGIGTQVLTAASLAFRFCRFGTPGRGRTLDSYGTAVALRRAGGSRAEVAARTRGSIQRRRAVIPAV